MRCQRAEPRPSAAITDSAAWIRFSPTSANPASNACRIRSCGTVLITPIRVTVSGDRPERAAAAAIRPRISFRRPGRSSGWAFTERGKILARYPRGKRKGPRLTRLRGTPGRDASGLCAHIRKRPAFRPAFANWWRRRESNPRPKTLPQRDTTGVSGRLSLVRLRSDRRDHRRTSPESSRPQPPGGALDQPAIF